MIRCRRVERHLTGSPIQGTSRAPKIKPRANKPSTRHPFELQAVR
jgi:hypothetical protein